MSLNSLVASFKQYAGNFTRRDLFRSGSLLAIPALSAKRATAAPRRLPLLEACRSARTFTSQSEFVHLSAAQVR